MGRVHGIKQLAATLKSIDRKIMKAIAPPALLKAADAIEEEARRDASRKTGNLQRSFRVVIRHLKRSQINALILVNAVNPITRTAYALAQNAGTKRFKGKHFMERAVAAKGQAAQQIAIDQMREGIENLLK